MDALETKDAERFALLDTFYDIVDGNSTEIVSLKLASQILGWDDDKISNTAQWLSDHNLPKWVAFDGSHSITPQGVDAVEDARRNATSKPTMSSNGELTVVVLTIDELRSVEEALMEIGRAEIEIKLNGDDQREFLADRNTILEQIKSPKPKKEIVFAALRGIRKFCYAVDSAVAATKISQVIG